MGPKTLDFSWDPKLISEVWPKTETRDLKDGIRDLRPVTLIVYGSWNPKIWSGTRDPESLSSVGRKTQNNNLNQP